MDITAAILWEQGTPLSVEAAELDGPGPGEVLVEMKAAGVCHSDLHPARGDWPAKTPLVLGHEGAGIVREVGAAVTARAAGRSRRALLGAGVRRVPAVPRGARGAVRPGREGDVSQQAAIGRRRGCMRAGRTSRRFSAPPASPTSSSSLKAGAIPVPHDVPFDALATIGCAVVTGVGAVTNAGAGAARARASP